MRELAKALTGLLALCRRLLKRRRTVYTVKYGHGQFKAWDVWRDRGLIYQIFDERHRLLCETDLPARTCLSGSSCPARCFQLLASVLCSKTPKAGDTIVFSWSGEIAKANIASVDGRFLVKSIRIDSGLADERCKR